MKAMKIRRLRPTGFLLVAVAAAMFGLADHAAAQAVDMTGTWTFQVDVQGQVTNPTATFEQAGNALTGQYSSATLGDADFTGTVDGSDVTFSFDAVLAAQGQQVPVSVTYDGTVDEEGVFTGTIDLGGMAGGSVTGTRDM